MNCVNPIGAASRAGRPPARWRPRCPLPPGSRLRGSVAVLALTSALLGFGNLHAWTPATFFLAGLTSVALMSILAGVLLDSLRRSNREIKRMLYLAVHPIHGPVPDRRGGWSPVPQPGAEIDSKAPLANVAHSAREG